MLTVQVRDDGAGGARLGAGTGLIGLQDRVEALGGQFTLHSPLGQGTTVTAQLPITTDGRHRPSRRKDGRLARYGESSGRRFCPGPGSGR